MKNKRSCTYLLVNIHWLTVICILHWFKFREHIFRTKVKYKIYIFLMPPPQTTLFNENPTLMINNVKYSWEPLILQSRKNRHAYKHTGFLISKITFLLKRVAPSGTPVIPPHTRVHKYILSQTYKSRHHHRHPLSPCDCLAAAEV